jgi:hypothetical protein
MYGDRNNAMRVLAFIAECNSYNFHDECIFLSARPIHKIDEKFYELSTAQCWIWLWVINEFDSMNLLVNNLVDKQSNFFRHLS